MSDDFRDRWRFVRGMTIEFLTVMPDDVLDRQVATGFTNVRAQAVHLVECEGVYLDGCRGRTVDFARKPEFTPRHDDVPTIIAAMRALDEELEALLDAIAASPQEFALDWFGRRIGLWEFGAVMIQHEALHHGQWAVHAHLGGDETPPGWQLNWGL